MRRLLLDQGLAPFAAVILRTKAFDAIHVLEIGLERADDEKILRRAADEQRVCVTLDHDFHAHLAVAGQGSPSVILLRTQGLNALAQAELIEIVYSQCEVALQAGAAVSADRNSVRVRRLPLR